MSTENKTEVHIWNQDGKRCYQAVEYDGHGKFLKAKGMSFPMPPRKINKRRVNNMTMEEVKQGEFFIFENKGDKIEGKLTAIRDGVHGKVFDIIDTTGKEWTLGTKTVLTTKITEDFVGKRISVEFIGNVKGKDYTYSDFKVMVDR